MFLIYTALLWLALPFILIYHLYRSISRGRPAALASRFGLVAGSELARLSELAKQGPIWVHAVSVGETIAVKPLLQALKKAHPLRPIILSNMTETGRSVAQKLPEVDHCLYFPFDYTWAVRRLFILARPSLIVVMETELWPNFLRTARQMQIPAVIVNGRISDRSLDRYLRLRWFFRPVLAQVAAFCMQTEEDARRIRAIGAEPAVVQVTRNLKYDIPVALPDAAELAAIRAAYRLPPDTSIITVGSTHPGEEPQVLAAFQAVLAAGESAVLVLVPRHPERAAEVAELLQRARLPFLRRSQLREETAPFEGGGVLLVDTIGELRRLYAVSDLVFVGGSLVPVGGHNVLEPAALGVPVLFGPHMSNFREIAQKMAETGGGMQVADGSELTKAILALLKDRTRRQEVGRRGMALLTDNSGATGRHLAILDRYLGRD